MENSGHGTFPIHLCSAHQNAILQTQIRNEQTMKKWLISIGLMLACQLLVAQDLPLVKPVPDYGFAHFDFPLKKMWMAILVGIFLLPTMLMSIPTYVIFNRLGFIGSLKSYIYPALTGFGLRQSVFILIFYQFFKVIPKELSESAEMDGASELGIFFRIAVPMSVPAFIICMLYSFVWYWNETLLATSYFSGNITTLQMALTNFEYTYTQLYPAGSIGIGAAAESFNQGVLFAGTILTILPLLLLYAFTQKWFVESADRSGIAGD